jgi:PAS domain S-box-containing protein
MKQSWAHVVFSLAILFACCNCAFALDPSLDISQYAHTAWKIPDGFTRGAIYSIAQTPDGYLWLGTEFGLVRFDGVRAVPWQPPAGEQLPSEFIARLRVTRDGRLWIGTLKGLASWKDKKLTQYPKFAGQQINALLEDQKGTLWVGGFSRSARGELCAIQSGSVHCDDKGDALGNGVMSLFEDRKGNLWVGVNKGLWRWKPGSREFYSMPDDPAGIQCLADGDDGALLIGARSGVKRLFDGKIEPYPLPRSIQPVIASGILHDRGGGLWIGTVNRGLVHVHQGRADVFSVSDGLSGDVASALFEDREGNIWVATYDGLDRFRDFAAATFSMKQGLSDPIIGSILADRDGSVWIATYGGLDRWNHGQTTHYGKQERKLNGIATRSLFQDSRGRIWVSNNREFGYLQDKRFVPIRGIPDSFVHGITEDTMGNLWIADEEALFHLSPRGEVKQIPWVRLEHKDYASAIAADPLQGGVWIGFTNGGITHFLDGQIRASYTSANGLGAGRVSHFQFDRDGTVWIATEGGLSRLKNGRVATLTSDNGLPCNSVHWVIEDNDYSSWLYTRCGLIRIARSGLDAWGAEADKVRDSRSTIQATVFDVSDGVRALDQTGPYSPQVSKSSAGQLWFLRWDGVSVIDPRHIPFNKVPPPVHIEQITADGKSYDAASPLDGRFRLPPLVHDLTIQYTALSLVASEKVHFRFKLEGQDPAWREVVNQREVQYSNLRPGNYRFRVMACNNSGVWNEEGASLDFAIAPAYYQTNWFRALCVVAFLALLWAAFQVRVRQLRNEEAKFREAVETMPALAFIAMPDGQRTFVNGRWVEYTGLTEQKALGWGWQSVVHPDDLRRVVKAWQDSLSSGNTLEYESRLRHGMDRNYRWFQTRAVPVRDKRGRIVKWYGVINDIEDRKRAEQLQADLAHVNRVTTMGELTASLSHEIKQPITAAVTNADTCVRLLGLDQPDVPEAREAALGMVKDARRAAQIIDRVRSMYRKTPTQSELVDVNEAIGDMVLILHNEANRHSVTMHTEFAEGLPKVMADRVQLQQVLMNLMLNSVEAMKETGGVLAIKSQPGQDGRVLISVSDTGVGLPADHADRIFDAFFSTKPQGSGMGLAISRSILDSYGGRIWAEPNEGRGATFYFTLPTAAEVANGAAET